MKKLIYILMFIISISFVSASSDDNQLSCYKFDISTHMNDSTTIYNATNNGAFLMTEGKLGQAYDFGANDYGDIPHDGSLKGLAEVTISAWVNMSSLNQADENTIYSAADTESCFLLRYNSDTGIMDFFWFDGEGTQSSSNTAAIEDGAWHHIVGAVNSSGDIYMYLDGVLLANKDTTVSACNAGSTDNHFGRFTDGTPDTWLGGMDEVRVYDRGLPRSEILELYNGSNAISCNTTVAAPPPSDTTPPAGNLTTITNNSVYNATKILIGSLWNETGDIRIYINWTLNQTELSVSAGTNFTFITNLSNGTYLINATNTDSSSNVGETPFFIITIANVTAITPPPPAPSATKPRFFIQFLNIIQFWINSVGDMWLAGNLNVTGNVTGNQIYGEMFNHTDDGQTITIDDSTSYFNITSLNAGLNNGFTVTNNALIPSIDGTYKFNWAIGFGNTGNNVEYQIALKVNEIIKGKCETHRKVGASGDVGSASGTCFLSLNSNDEVRLGIKNIDGTQNAVMFNVNVNAVRVGD